MIDKLGMEIIVKKKLEEDIAIVKQSNLNGLDENSFSAGYSSGFSRGFYFAMKWFLIALALSFAITSTVFSFFEKISTVSLFGVLLVAFFCFVAGATRERVLRDQEDFKKQ